VIVKGNTFGSGKSLNICTHPESPEPWALSWRRGRLGGLDEDEYNAALDRLKSEWIQDVLCGIRRPVFTEDEMILVEQFGGVVSTGRFHGPYHDRGDTIYTPLFILASPSTATDHEEEPQP
jgi:hypothetical protein